MSSDILTESIDVTAYGVIFFGAQKNVGTSGVTVVIVRESLLGQAARCPVVFDYTEMSKASSLYNTPPCYPIYVAGLMFEWALAQGGLAALVAATQRKAELIYAAIDASAGFYVNSINAANRSRTNIVFRIGSAEHRERLESEFVAQARDARMTGLAGHRSVGGIRVSLYIGIPHDYVEVLARFMQQFVNKHAH
jgi:phosphoserine aminotransferase